MIVAAMIVSAHLAGVRAQASRSLDVYWIDTEGGGATLIVTPAGESVLVDAGNPGGRDSGRILKTAKETAHLQRIDAIVVTHLHGDHFGGVAEVAAGMPVGTLYENGIDNAPAAERAQRTLPPYRDAKVEKRVVAQVGDVIPLKRAPGAPAIQLRIVGARQHFMAFPGSNPNLGICKNATPKAADESDNANSIVMVLEHGPFRMFLGGDLTWNAEEKLVCPDSAVNPVDVMQSVHHGLDLSNNPVLVQTLQPHVVVFNNGARKGFQPNAAATVAATPSVEAVYQMHRAVSEGAKNSADDRIANKDEQCAGDGIVMSVAPDGKSYEVRVPSTGHRKTYKTRGQ